jgi:transposase
MSRFPTAARLASWAGLCPTNKESGGGRIQGPMNRGNVWLRAITGEVAWASIKIKASYFFAQFHRIARRRERNKAAIAVAHSILTAIYHVLRTGQPTPSSASTTLTVSTRLALNGTMFGVSSNSAMP